MKKLFVLLFLIPFVCAAQPGYIYTVIGNGTSGFSGDGGPATSAKIGQVLGNVHIDAAGNIYFGDHPNGRIRKVNTAGIITTIAGGGSSTADGIPATAASLGFYGNGVLTADAAGNLYFPDNHRIRKIDLATGMITTVAGTLVAGYSGDGGPATAAMLRSPVGLCFDAAGNLYIGDEDNYRIRKVDAAGVITTFAGTGTAGYSGDGGPAIAAQMQSPDGICFDASGNMYVADRYNYRIRKITPGGVISTYAGIGTVGFSGDSGPATAAEFFEPSGVCMDPMGNLFIADFHNSRVRKVDPYGIVTTYAGGGSIGGDGIPATSASFSDVWAIGMDGSGSIYVSDRIHFRVCRVGPGIPTAAADSLSAYVSNSCTSVSFSIFPAHYSSSLSVQTWFGDGTSQTNSFSASTSYLTFTHNYSYSGVYTVKHVLFNGATPLDTLIYSHVYNFCRTLPVRTYVDANSDCVFDASGEFAVNSAIKVAVDSAGIPIDTISMAAGTDYQTNGSVGTVYRFRVVGTVPGLIYTCPASGVLTYTVTASANAIQNFGFQCSGTSGFDLGEHVAILSGKHTQRGQVVVANAYCLPQTATLSLHFSPKYHWLLSVSPAPTYTTATTVTWSLGSLSSSDAGPKHITYHLERIGPNLIPGDTVTSNLKVTPTMGDMVVSNNNCDDIDTVKSSFDPNAIDVSPAACFAAGATPTLTYTIQFENTGNDTAHNVYVLDTISNSLDISTFSFVASSHKVIVSKMYNGSNWVLKFDHPNIKLLDSSRHDGNKGMFVYSIKPKPGLAIGVSFINRAGIYFDDNEPILTNDAHTAVCLPSLLKDVADAQLVLYPNPVDEELHLDNVDVAVTYKVATITGKTVLAGNLTVGKNVLRLPDMAPGVYTVELISMQGAKKVMRFVKQ